MKVGQQDVSDSILLNLPKFIWRQVKMKNGDDGVPFLVPLIVPFHSGKSFGVQEYGHHRHLYH